MKTRFGYLGQVDTTGSQDIDELERLNKIEQDAKDREAARKTTTLEELLGITKSFVGGLIDPDKDKKATGNGTGTGTGGGTTFNFPGTQINMATFLLPAALIGGVLLLTARRR